jgi:hypothetical protein
MTTRWPSSGLGAVSNVQRFYYVEARFTVARLNIRHYSSQPSDNNNNNNNKLTSSPATPEKPEKAALLAVTNPRHGLIDAINPPRSTVPPVLKLPTRGPENIALHLYRTGKAYGGFYFTGVKSVWFNRKASQVIRERLGKDGNGGQDEPSMVVQSLSRSEFQILARNKHDIGKLPLFSVLVALLGEWLPLFVPFMPGVVPGTCRIPKQITGMREKAEQRRRTSFRTGTTEPRQADFVEASAKAESSAKKGDAWPICSQPHATALLGKLEWPQLFHLSNTLNVHSRLWDRLAIPPPTSLLRRGVGKRLAYICTDDVLLLKHGDVTKLLPEEVLIACEERGIDVNGRRGEVLREDLKRWLQAQRREQGLAIFRMLFRR